MTRFLSIEKAAARVERSERTIKRWGESGLAITAGMVREDALLEMDKRMRERRGRPKGAKAAAAPTATMFRGEQEVSEYLELESLPWCAVSTPIEEPMLLGVTGDGELFYVGIPTEGESAGEVEQNNGWLADLPDARWPLTLLVPGSGVTEDGS